MAPVAVVDNAPAASSVARSGGMRCCHVRPAALLPWRRRWGGDHREGRPQGGGWRRRWATWRRRATRTSSPAPWPSRSSARPSPYSSRAGTRAPSATALVSSASPAGRCGRTRRGRTRPRSSAPTATDSASSARSTSSCLPSYQHTIYQATCLITCMLTAHP